MLAIDLVPSKESRIGDALIAMHPAEHKESTRRPHGMPGRLVSAALTSISQVSSGGDLSNRYRELRAGEADSFQIARRERARHHFPGVNDCRVPAVHAKPLDESFRLGHHLQGLLLVPRIAGGENRK
jgi:hypothetical protein